MAKRNETSRAAKHSWNGQRVVGVALKDGVAREAGQLSASTIARIRAGVEKMGGVGLPAAVLRRVGGGRKADSSRANSARRRTDPGRA